MSNALNLGICALAVALQGASANITFDLRGTGPSAFLNGKCVLLAGGGEVVQLELWAQVTNVAPVNNVFGVQTILGAIISSGGAGIVGALQPMTFPPVFGSSAIPGAQAELSLPPDNIGDLGTSSVTSTANYPKPRKDPTTGGEAVLAGSTMFATNNAPAGATFHAIPNGYEFLMGFTTLNITDINGFTSAYLNWKIPSFATAALRGALGVWTDGDGANNTGSTQFAEMSVGEPVIIGCLPEPATFEVLLLGTMCLVGRYRTRGSVRALESPSARLLQSL